MSETATVSIDPSNTDQVRAWDGDEGRHWAAHAEWFERSIAAYDDRFFAAAAITPAARVLDIGCGNGGSAIRAARIATAGSVLGVDLSERMLAVARTTAAAAGVGNVRFLRADAQIHDFTPGTFDVAIARTSAMFFGDPAAALRNIGRALRPGGRLVLLNWQELARNPWILAVRTAFAAGRDLPVPPPEAPSPFALADPDRMRRLLGAAGFAGVSIEGLEAPMHLGADVDTAVRILSGVLGWMLADLDAAARETALRDFRATLERNTTADGVRLGSATWLVTAVRH